MTKKRSTKAAARPSPRKAVAIAANARKPVRERVLAMAAVPTAVVESDENLQAMLTVLRDTNEPREVRLKALQALQAASFSVVAFESGREDYIAALRDVADDPDEELRQRVLGLLAREKDRHAQKMLVDGLRDPDKALLPPEKALQLLGYDPHADAYATARDIVANPPNAEAKREALRLLAADASSAPMFEKVLLDKDESSEARRISAAALQSLRPEKLQAYARKILLDPSEDDDVAATSLTAITQFGDREKVTGDTDLKKRVKRLTSAGAPKIKRAARRFEKRYGK